MRTIPLLTAVLATLGAPALAQGGPFPTDKNTRIEDEGAIYTVAGRQRIPRRVSITAMRAITIQGEGEGAVLEVSGDLKLQPATGGRIELKDLWLEITPECRDLELRSCAFTGKGGIRPSPDGPNDTRIFMSNVEFERGTTMTLEASGGDVDMLACFFDGPLVLRGIPRSERAGSTLVVSMLSSKGGQNGRPKGVLGGITVEGLKEALIRNCDIAGPEALFVDNGKLTFDGNNARAARVEFKNSSYGKFKGLDVKNCDFRTPALVFTCPTLGKKAERIVIDHSYFGGSEDPDTIKREKLSDQENNPETGALTILKDVCTVPLGLGGDQEL